MGDRVYANVRFGGQVKTVEDFAKLGIAILEEEAHQETDRGTKAIRNLTDVQEALLEFVASGKTPKFGDDEVNYGTFEAIEQVCKDIGIWSWTYFHPGSEFTEGEKVVNPNGEDIILSLDDGHYTVQLSELVRCRQSADPMMAIDALINLSGPPDFPPFTLSDEVLTHFAPDLARLKIAGKAA